MNTIEIERLIADSVAIHMGREWNIEGTDEARSSETEFRLSRSEIAAVDGLTRTREEPLALKRIIALLH